MTGSFAVVVTDDRRYPHGVPSWVDVALPDPDAAQQFYGALFGWQFHEAMPPGAPGSYVIATLNGHHVAALAPAESGARWNTYIACDDADTSAAVIRSAGGQVTFGPEDAGPGGRLAVCTDPGGGEFRLWQARRRLGAQVVNEPNSWNFSDLHTLDRVRDLEFYAAVFGWEVDPDHGAGMIRLTGYGDHLAATVDPHIYQRQASAPPGFADVVAGIADVTEEPGWQVRFTVTDRDASAAVVESAGGQVVSTVDTPWTREALVRDPQGAELRLSQFAPPS